MTEAEERHRVVEVARTWIGTPFISRAKVRGHGADCGTLIAACFEEAGLLPKIDLPDYTVQWHLNKSDELYLAVIEQHMLRFIGPPLPGDIVMWKIGRAFSHAAIVVKWPVIIHALWRARFVMLDDADRCPELQRVQPNERPDGSTRPRARRFYSYWAPI